MGTLLSPSKCICALHSSYIHSPLSFWSGDSISPITLSYSVLHVPLLWRCLLWRCGRNGAASVSTVSSSLSTSSAMVSCPLRREHFLLSSSVTSHLVKLQQWTVWFSLHVREVSKMWVCITSSEKAVGAEEGLPWGWVKPIFSYQSLTDASFYSWFAAFPKQSLKM